MEATGSWRVKVEVRPLNATGTGSAGPVFMVGAAVAGMPM
jgi:hypothetical protein